MRIFPILFAFFLIGLLLWDFIFLPKSSRRILKILAWIFGMGAAVSIDPRAVSHISGWIGLGRPVDGVLYFVVVILIREFFLSRVRRTQLENQMTQLVRRIAIEQRSQKVFQDHH